jgi:membrane-associated protease RseP (regulator of RpoE activity)
VADSAREAFRATGAPDLALAEMRSGYEAGDLAPFAAAKVPSLLLFTGPQADYHRPSDTEDKIDYAGLGKVGRFAARAAPLFGRLAAAGFVGPSPSTSAPPAPGGDRPFLGTVPDFQAPPGEGVLVAEVVPASPAEAAGIRAGDRVVGLGGTPTAGLKEYAAALRLWKPGDRVSVTIRRGAETIETEAVLTKRVEEQGRPSGHPSGAPRQR